ncbi:cupin domain-containing protein [Streptomyces sp. NRRL S-87]|uniref:cupin domain-containing protein n=1 Tax=Streptomyces sp. NRRL S-87 TaxID=1463920 RepID=UPI0006904383|nr:cupin domain-containing protein [Streptomyces sp. NRRL S-87]
MAKHAHVRHDGDAPAYWVLNSLYEVIAASEETAGAFAVMRMTVPEGWGPPLHTHPGTESCYVLEGTVRLHLEDEIVECGPGDFFHIPAGHWERFEPTSTVRLLVTYAPGANVDRMFAEMGVPAERRELPPETEPDLEHILQVTARYGLEMRPPAAL